MNRMFFLPEDEKLPGYITSPGEFIRDELNERGWSQGDLANIIGRPQQAVNEIINGRKQITVDTAIELGQAFGTSAELWLNLERDYRLWLAQQNKSQAELSDIQIRARIHELLPLKEVQKRRWIPENSDTHELAKAVITFFNLNTLSDEPVCLANFRQSFQRGPETAPVTAWLKQVEKIAEKQSLPPFYKSKLVNDISDLLSLTEIVEDIPKTPSFLFEHGIHFVLLPHLQKSYLDGAALWYKNRPVIALTGRYDRIDNFWFTLMHEIAHIILGHESQVDDLHEKRYHTENDDEANNWAANMLIPDDRMQSFIHENNPHFSKKAVETFAASLERHPGIIVGRLHHLEQISYQSMRQFLVKISSYLKEYRQM